MKAIAETTYFNGGNPSMWEVIAALGIQAEILYEHFMFAETADVDPTSADLIESIHVQNQVVGEMVMQYEKLLKRCIVALPDNFVAIRVRNPLYVPESDEVSDISDTSPDDLGDDFPF